MGRAGAGLAARAVLRRVLPGAHGLLFVAGVMKTVWIAAITLYVLLEKVVLHGRLLSKLAGIGMISAGLWMIAA